MKRHFIILSLSGAFIFFLLQGCAKKNDQKQSAPSPLNPVTMVRDQIDISMLMSGMITGATMTQSAVASGKVATGDHFNGMGWGKPVDFFCGANISSGEAGDSLYVAVGYDGPDCSGRYYLKGTVLFKVPKWQGWQLATPGRNSAVHVNMNGLNITRQSDNHHMWISGTLAFIYDNKDTVDEPDLIASVYDLPKANDPTRTVEQRIESNNYNYKLTIHYDDGKTMPFITEWIRQYRWDKQFIIYQTGYGFGGWGKPSWPLWGTDTNGRPFHWLSLKPMYMYQNCQYKIADGLLGLQYGDDNPDKDSASIAFGLDKYGNPPSEAVQKGQACQDSFYLRVTIYKQGVKTSEELLPE